MGKLKKKNHKSKMRENYEIQKEPSDYMPHDLFI